MERAQIGKVSKLLLILILTIVQSHSYFSGYCGIDVGDFDGFENDIPEITHGPGTPVLDIFFLVSYFYSVLFKPDNLIQLLKNMGGCVVGEWVSGDFFNFKKEINEKGGICVRRDVT